MPGITPTGPITEHEIKDAVFEIYQQKKERIKKLIYQLGISSFENPEWGDDSQWNDHYETYKNTEVFILLEAYDRLQLKHALLKKRIETLERILSNKKM